MIKYALILCIAGFGGLAGCKDGPAEPDTEKTAGDELEEAAEDTGDAIEEAGDDADEAVDEATE